MQLGSKTKTMSKRFYLNNDWYFAEDWDKPEFRQVRLPHTCKELPLHYFDEQEYQMLCGYAREVFVPEEWQGSVLLLTFEGAAHQATVYVNGLEAGVHNCGYTAFTLDISKLVKYGESNQVAVKLDTRESLDIPPFGFVVDYLTYGGIYRDVYLDVKPPTYIKEVFVRTGRKAADSYVLFTEIDLGGEMPEESQRMKIRQSIRKHGEKEFTELGVSSALAVVTKFEMDDVVEWSPDAPQLYDVKTELIAVGEATADEATTGADAAADTDAVTDAPTADADAETTDELIDVVVTTMGFREAEFRKDGFYLNGEKYKIRGLNRHQSYPYVGYAMPDSMQKRDADILKHELGLNAVRTSHYPQSQAFIDRCDEVGLLVFTELPGWQHIGGKAWKEQAIENVKEMVLQYRNHPSIILWGVRINESVDDEEFYERTNATAHILDPTRQTGGVRCYKKGTFQEDVFTYNDFSHRGSNAGVEKKSHVTSDKNKAYLITEYNGHMYPTKAFDDEDQKLSHALRHANVLEDAAAEEDIAGTFGWCMFDYNTHKDFGSGDRICYHGVMDMFRNPKLAAAVYASQQDETPVLEVSSSMDIGEHAGGNRGDVYIFTNADSVKMYKNGHLIKEYVPDHGSRSRYGHLAHPPILIDDYIGDTLEIGEQMPHAQAADISKLLNETARYGLYDLPKTAYAKAGRVLLKYRMNLSDMTELYTKYIGGWGGASTIFEFAAIKDGQEVKRISKAPVEKKVLYAEADRMLLQEGKSYDVAAVRIRLVDEYGNTLPFANDPVTLKAEGAVELIGPDILSLQGGMGGTYVRTTGEEGEGRLTIRTPEGQEKTIVFQVERQ